MDKRCQEIVNYIVQKQQEFAVGDSLGIPDCKLTYRILRIMSPVELKKIKKDFVKFCRQKPPRSKADFGDAFLEYLNSSADRE